MRLNWLLVLLIISQFILRQYFPNSTHALYNDWAYFTFYLLFFISGFVLFTSEKITNSIKKQRRLYLYQTLLFTILLFMLPTLFGKPSLIQNSIRGMTEIIISLSCGITALGYFKCYFNRDHKWRKILNDAIYPFYLLHQPALIFVGYIILDWDISCGMQAFWIILFSLIFIISSYLIIIKFNLLRIVFGMKKKSKKETQINNMEAEKSFIFDK